MDERFEHKSRTDPAGDGERMFASDAPGPARMALGPGDVEAVARRTVELLRGERLGPFALVDARELARQLGVSVDYVYEHSAQLGALRLGNGRKARIRFEVDTARQALAESRRGPRTVPKKRRI